MNEDTCTGHTPDVWQCQNPECGDTLSADTIGRDGEGEDTSNATLFCTSCSSRDVRPVTYNDNSSKPEPVEHINMQQVPIRTDAGREVRNAISGGPQHVLFRKDWSI